MGNRVWWHRFSFFTIPQHAQWKKCQDTWFNNLLFSWISNQIWSSLPDKVLLTGSQIVNTRNDVFTGKFAFISLFLCRPMNRHILKSVWVLKNFFHRLTLCSESLLLLMKQKKNKYKNSSAWQHVILKLTVHIALCKCNFSDFTALFFIFIILLQKVTSKQRDLK